MKKLLWFLIGLIVFAGASALYVDYSGARHVCHEVLVYSPADTVKKRQVLVYEHDSMVHQHKMPALTRFIGLNKGEKVGLELQVGRMTGFQYKENYYLPNADQSSRVSLGKYVEERRDGQVETLPLGVGCDSPNT
jgi:hypothetical protein